MLQSRSLCEGPAPGSGSTLDKTKEILNDILVVHSKIDKRLIKKQKNDFFSSEEGGML